VTTAVAEIMAKDLIVLEEWENLLDVARDMHRHHLRHLPVVDGKRLIGIVSHRDLLRFTASQLAPGAISREHDRSAGENAFVRNVMTREVQTVSPTTSVGDAARLLVEHRFGCLPVVDNDELVGMVTEHDLLKLLTDPSSR
jgi:CBS domain-containing protein